jgi:hypothetical protein
VIAGRATGRGCHNLNDMGAFFSLGMRAEAPECRLLPATRGWNAATAAAACCFPTRWRTAG